MIVGDLVEGGARDVEMEGVERHRQVSLRLLLMVYDGGRPRAVGATLDQLSAEEQFPLFPRAKLQPDTKSLLGGHPV